MAGSSATRSKRRAEKSEGGERLFDRELEALPADLRWREWLLRVEAVIFAAAEPVTRETLARVVGKDCSIDLLIDDLQQERSGRPYEIVPVAGGWQHSSCPAYADAIRASAAPTRSGVPARSAFGMETLRNLPDVEAIEDAWLLSRVAVQKEALPAQAESEEE